jgi:hypothetical protein
MLEASGKNIHCAGIASIGGALVDIGTLSICLVNTSAIFETSPKTAQNTLVAVHRCAWPCCVRLSSRSLLSASCAAALACVALFLLMMRVTGMTVFFSNWRLNVLKSIRD